MKGYYDLITHDLPKADEIIIYPIADPHVGAAGHDAKGWEAFCKRIVAEPNSYVTLGGDLMNNNTRSSVGSPWDDTIRPREQKRLLVEQLKPLRDAGKILCIVPGNHENRSLKDADDNPLYDVACKLDLEDIYREDGAFVRVGIGKPRVGA
jgi:predicted MPP superfamily phosphohydrolase